MTDIIVSSRQEIKTLLKEVLNEHDREVESKKKPEMQVADPKDDLITRMELLKRLKISPVKLWKMMRRKEIPYLRSGKRVFFRFSKVIESMEK